MKRKCDEVFCKFNDLTKSVECFYKKHNSAFTVAELVVTILVLAFLVFVLLGFMNRDQQKEFDAKNDKTEANIHALIDKASVTRTGNSILRNDVLDIQNIITTADNNGLNITDPNCGDECWGADENETPGAITGLKILLNDQTTIAFAQVNSRIYIDANGAKAPNRLGRDIREFQYETLARTASTSGVSPSGGCTLTDSMCSTQGKIFDSVNCQCVDESCSLTSEICTAEGKTFDSVNCKCVGDDSCSLTTEICTAEGKFFDFAKCECSTSCPALAKNEVWTNESECKRCTRGEKPKNAQWGTANTVKACTWACIKGNSNSTYNQGYNKNYGLYNQTYRLYQRNFSNLTLRQESYYIKLWKERRNVIMTTINREEKFNNETCEYTYPCKTGKENTFWRTLNADKTKEIGDINSETCRYNYKCKTFGEDNTIYVIWRETYDSAALGTGNADTNGYRRSLRNLIELGTVTGRLPADNNLSEKLNGDWSFNANTKPQNCSANEKSSKIKCTKDELDEMNYPVENVEAYFLSPNADILGYVASEDSGIKTLEDTYKIQSDLTIEKKGVNDVSQKNSIRNFATSGTVTINGCPYNVIGYYRQGSPLVLDLLDDGFKFTSVDDGVMFDIDADGKIDKVAWTTRQTKFDNAFLVLDKNNNGQVDNGSELFGDQNGAETGFGELAKYDDNGDKLITKADAIFDKLRLWVDFNKDAHVDKGEWKTLEEAGITELSTEYKVETDADGNVKTDSHGNKVGFVGWFKQKVETVVNGVKTFVEKVKTMIDVFFQFK